MLFPFIFVKMGGKIDSCVKGPKIRFPVIPAKAGIRLFQYVLGSGFRRGDDLRAFLQYHHFFISV
jgi:hypothetical protein